MCHFLFYYVCAKDLWSILGILQTIEDAKEVDHSGSEILEHLILAEDRPVPLKPNLEVKHIVAVGSWYLWWIRCQLTHNEKPPPPTRWPMSVLAKTNNFHQANFKKPDAHE